MLLYLMFHHLMGEWMMVYFLNLPPSFWIIFSLIFFSEHHSSRLFDLPGKLLSGIASKVPDFDVLACGTDVDCYLKGTPFADAAAIYDEVVSISDDLMSLKDGELLQELMDNINCVEYTTEQVSMEKLLSIVDIDFPNTADMGCSYAVPVCSKFSTSSALSATLEKYVPILEPIVQKIRDNMMSTITNRRLWVYSDNAIQIPLFTLPMSSYGYMLGETLLTNKVITTISGKQEVVGLKFVPSFSTTFEFVLSIPIDDTPFGSEHIDLSVNSQVNAQLEITSGAEQILQDAIASIEKDFNIKNVETIFYKSQNKCTIKTFGGMWSVFNRRERQTCGKIHKHIDRYETYTLECNTLKLTTALERGTDLGSKYLKCAKELNEWHESLQELFTAPTELEKFLENAKEFWNPWDILEVSSNMATGLIYSKTVEDDDIYGEAFNTLSIQREFTNGITLGPTFEWSGDMSKFFIP